MFDRVQRGDPLRIRAETWNSILDVVERAQRVGLGAHVEVDDLQNAAEIVMGYLDPSATVSLKRFSICHIGEPIETLSHTDAHPYVARNLVYELTLLDASNETGIELCSNLAVVLEDIAPGECGLAAIHGFVPVATSVLSGPDYIMAPRQTAIPRKFSEPWGTLGWGAVPCAYGPMELHCELCKDIWPSPYSPDLWLVNLKGRCERYVVEAIEEYEHGDPPVRYPPVKVRTVLAQWLEPSFLHPWGDTMFGQAFYAVLPHTEQYYPNVPIGRQFWVRPMPSYATFHGRDCVAYAVGHEYLDAPLGTVRIVDRRVLTGETTNVPLGWELVPLPDGTPSWAWPVLAYAGSVSTGFFYRAPNPETVAVDAAHDLDADDYYTLSYGKTSDPDAPLEYHRDARSLQNLTIPMIRRVP